MNDILAQNSQRTAPSQGLEGMQFPQRQAVGSVSLEAKLPVPKIALIDFCGHGPEVDLNQDGYEDLSHEDALKPLVDERYRTEPWCRSDIMNDKTNRMFDATESIAKGIRKLADDKEVQVILVPVSDLKGLQVLKNRAREIPAHYDASIKEVPERFQPDPDGTHYRRMLEAAERISNATITPENVRDYYSDIKALYWGTSSDRIDSDYLAIWKAIEYAYSKGKAVVLPSGNYDHEEALPATKQERVSNHNELVNFFGLTDKAIVVGPLDKNGNKSADSIHNSTVNLNVSGVPHGMVITPGEEIDPNCKTYCLRDYAIDIDGDGVNEVFLADEGGKEEQIRNYALREYGVSSFAAAATADLVANLIELNGADTVAKRQKVIDDLVKQR